MDKIFNVDDSVRIATICDMRGVIIEQRKREDVIDFLTQKQNSILLNHTIDYWNFRKKTELKTGSLEFILEHYGSLRRLVMPINHDLILIVSFDKEGGQHDIIERIGAVISGDYTQAISSGPQN